ncbi:MAG: PIG-L family deacetylase [Gammaproteobacteria bacterium]|nr:MAG: PIG-L family deacetylase [Gammaproteobacteria bacterium]
MCGPITHGSIGSSRSVARWACDSASADERRPRETVDAADRSVQGGGMRERPMALFLFAHQDDECFAFHLIASELAAGRRVRCAYFTDGGVKCARRNRESLRVLGGMGVAEADICFVGEAQGIPDGRLLSCLSQGEEALRALLPWREQVAAIYVPAWEGGHPDHDSLHRLAVVVARDLMLTDRLFQFSLYHAKGMPWPLYKVMTPLEVNGPFRRVMAPFASRLRHAVNCFRYPSQWISWFDLFPMVAVSYLLGRQFVQPVDPRRSLFRPHEGALYYETRHLARWEEVKATLGEGASDEGGRANTMVEDGAAGS